MNVSCPLCRGDLARRKPADGHWIDYQCDKCGPYSLNDSAEAIAPDLFSNEEREWLPFNIRIRASGNGVPPRLTSHDLEQLKKQVLKPSPAEAADNLIRLVGGAGPFGTGTALHTQGDATAYQIGLTNPMALSMLLRELLVVGILIELSNNLSAQIVALTMKGSQRYEQLAKGTHSGRSAFMAMQYGEGHLEQVVTRCLRPCVSETGFELRVLNDPEHQRAGLIDDRLRVQIKAARFLIVDLTHENRGAYWEAGYGEGLGKPVIYTCQKSFFSARRDGGGTHFDTNHHLHILWELDELDRVGEELKACIRATIPEATPAKD